MSEPIQVTVTLTFEREEGAAQPRQALKDVIEADLLRPGQTLYVVLGENGRTTDYRLVGVEPK